MVKRVSERVGRGLTLALALAAEDNPKINEETWKKALQAHPEFSPHYEAGKGKFLAMATARLAASEDLKFLCWLLERRHPQLFAKPEPQPATSVQVNQSVSLSIPADVVERAREIAARDQDQDQKQDPKPKADGHGHEKD